MYKSLRISQVMYWLRVIPRRIALAFVASTISVGSEIEIEVVLLDISESVMSESFCFNFIHADRVLHIHRV